MTAHFEWHVLNLTHHTRFKRVQRTDFALLLLNCPLTPVPKLDSLWKNARVRVAADGGANRIYDLLQCVPSSFVPDTNLDVIVGGLDSLRPDAREHFTASLNPTQVVEYCDQDLYGPDKAVHWIRKSYAANIDIVMIGDLGGRVDHGLRLIHYLHLFQPGPDYARGRVFLVTGKDLLILLKPGRHRIWVREYDEGLVGKDVGIVPIRKPSRITTKGLEKDVEGEMIMLGTKIHHSRVMEGILTLEIETSETVLFSINSEITHPLRREMRKKDSSHTLYSTSAPTIKNFSSGSKDQKDNIATWR